MAEASKIAHNLASASLGKAHRMRLAVRLYRMGWQRNEIAAVIGVGKNTVGKYIKQAKTMYHQQAVDDVQKWVADSLELLDQIEQVASQHVLDDEIQGTDVRTKETTGGKGGATTETWKEDHRSDPGWARVMLDVVKQRRELLSLDKQQERILTLRGAVAIDKTAEVSQEEADVIADALKQELMKEPT